MASRQPRNHTYINDGIVYTNYVFDGAGNEVKVAGVWSRWKQTRSIGHGKMDGILSYDKGYVVNNITDVRVAGPKIMMLIGTKNGRRLYYSIDSYIMTTSGPRIVRELGIGTKLLTVDNYKNYFGDHISLSTSGNGRVRALLRNHLADFTINENGGTSVGGLEIHCHDFDTDAPIVEGNVITYGLNNYREGVKQLFGLPDSVTTDEVVSIKEAFKKNYAIAIYVDGPQNVVVQNGLILQSAQTPVRDDW